MKRIDGWLRAQGASEDVASWASSFGSDLDALWTQCPRADWMLAIAARLGVAPSAMTAAAREVARLATDLLADDDEAVAILDQLETSESLNDAALALERRSDAEPDPATSTALLVLACAARTPSDPSAAAMVAALTTQALVFDAGECGTMSVVGWSQATAADRVRAQISGATLRAAAQQHGF